MTPIDFWVRESNFTNALLLVRRKPQWIFGVKGSVVKTALTF
jgi:hypothetical protein